MREIARFPTLNGTFSTCSTPPTTSRQRVEAKTTQTLGDMIDERSTRGHVLVRCQRRTWRGKRIAKVRSTALIGEVVCAYKSCGSGSNRLNARFREHVRPIEIGVVLKSQMYCDTVPLR